MTLPETLSLTPSAKRPENAVAEVLRQQIISGRYSAGDWLPAERTLAREFGVDRRTVHLAIDRLVGAGLVIRRPHCRPIIGSAEDEARGGARAQTPSSNLNSGNSNFVALVMWRGSGEMERTQTAQQRIFWGMNQALGEAGRHGVFMDLGTLGTIEENAAQEAERLRYIAEQGFGGAVFYPYAYRSNGALIEEIQQSVPFVTIDRQCAAATDFVGIENYRAMYDTVQHLIAQGHRRIAYVTKNEPILAVQDRLHGYLGAMDDAGLEDMVLAIPEHMVQSKWTAIEAVFRLPAAERPTAAAVFNDYSAVHLTEYLKRLGLSIPADVAVTGFDDIVTALPGGVGLTTVAQPYEEIGRKAVELILRRMADPAAPLVTAHLPAPLVVRGSSGPPYR